MPRYDEMDDLLRRVRNRLVGTETESEDAPPARLPIGLQRDEDQYERVLACTQALLNQAELLRELTGMEALSDWSAAQREHVLTVLARVVRELWSAEVAVRRAGLHD